MPKKRRRGVFTKLERFLYKSSLCLIVGLIVAIVTSSVTLSEVNLKVQKLKMKVDEQENTNQSLAMKINEMASLDNIKAVTNSQGLAYNNENIKTITETE